MGKYVSELAFRVDGTEIKKGGKLLENFGKTGDKVAKGAVKSGGLIGKAFGGAGKGLMSINSAGSSLTGMFSGLSGVVGAISFAGITSQTLGYGKALNEVSTLVDTSVFDMGKLEDAVLRQSKEFGAMPIGTVKGYYSAISAGASTAEQAIEAMDASNKLAIGGVTSVEVAVDGLTTSMNAFGPEAGSFTDISDAMFVAMKDGKTTIEQLSTSIGTVAPIAATAGVSLEEVLSATAALTKGGVSTSSAMNGIRAAIATVIKPTKEAATLAADLGLEFNSAALESKGLAGFLQDVSEKTGGSTDAMAVLFGGVEALTPVLALTGKASGDFAATLEHMEDKAGATEEAFTKMSNSPGFQMGRIISGLTTEIVQLGKALGAKLVPFLKLVADNIGPLFEVVKTALATASDGVESFTTALAESDSWPFKALREFGTILSDLADYIQPLIGYFDEFALAAGAIAIIAGALTALAAAAALLASPLVLIALFATAVYAIYDNWDGIVAWWEGIWGNILDYTDNVVNYLDNLFPLYMQGMRDVFNVGMALLKGDWEGAWQALLSFSETLGTKFRQIGTDIMTGLVNGIEAGRQWIVDKISGLAEDLPLIVKKVLGIQSPSRVFMAIGEHIAEGLALGIEQGTTEVMKVATTMSKKAVEAFDNIKQGLIEERLELVEGADALRFHQLASKGFTEEKINEIMALERGNLVLQETAKVHARVEDEIRDTTNAQTLQNVELRDGVDAAHRLSLEMDGYTAEQAANEVATLGNMKIQREFAETLGDIIVSSNSVKEMFSSMGDWLKNWLKEKIAYFAANQITIGLNSLAGGLGGLGGLSSVLSGLGFGDAAAAATVGHPSGGTALATNAGAGVAGATMGSTLAAGAIGVYINGLVADGIASAAGGRGDTAANGAMLGTLFGGPLGGLTGGLIGGAFGSGKKTTETGYAVGYGDGGAYGQNYEDRERQNSMFQGKDTWTNYSNLDKDVSIALDSFFDSLMTSVRTQAEALGSTTMDAMEANFTIDVTKISNEEEMQQWLEDSTRAAYQGAFSTLGPEVQGYLSTMVDMTSSSVEDIAAAFDDLSFIGGTLVPLFEGMGLQLAGTMDASIVSIAKLADSMGGVDVLMGRMTLFYDEFVPAHIKAEATLAQATTSVYDWNAEIGRTSEFTTTGINSLGIFALGMGTFGSSAQLAINHIQQFTTGLDATSGSITLNRTALEEYMGALDRTTVAGEAAWQSANGLMGAFTAVGETISYSQEGVLAYRDSLDASTVAGAVALAQIDQFITGLDGTGESMQVNMIGLVNYGEALDLTTEAGQTAFESLNNLKTALGDSMVTIDGTTTAMGAYVMGLDLVTSAGIVGLNQVLAFATGIDESTGAITVNQSALDMYIASLNTNTVAGKEAYDAAMNLAESTGQVGNSAITTREEMYAYIATLDLNTEAGRAAAASALSQLEAIIALEDAQTAAIATMNVVNTAMANLNIRFDETSPSAIGAANSLVALMGGIDAFTAKTQNYYEMFYTEQEQANIALATAAGEVEGFNAELDLTGEAAIDTAEEFRDYVDSLDLQTEAGRLAYAQAMEVAKSMKAVSDNGGTTAEILAGLPETVNAAFENAKANMQQGMQDLAQDQIDLADGTGKATEEVIAAYAAVNEKSVETSKELVLTSKQFEATTIVVRDSSTAMNTSITDSAKIVEDKSVEINTSFDNTATKMDDVSKEIDTATGALGKAISDLATLMTTSAGTIVSAASTADGGMRSFSGSMISVAGAASSAAGIAASAAGAATRAAGDASIAAASARDAAGSASKAASDASHAASDIGKISYLDGSHASGLASVPFNGYVAELHKDEMIMPANVSNWMRGAGVKQQAPRRQTRDNTSGAIKELRDSMKEIERERKDATRLTNELLQLIAGSTMENTDVLNKVEVSNNLIQRGLR